MSKLRIEKLKQGSASNNDVLVFRNDLGTFQGQSNLSVNTITLGTNTVNSSVYTGTAYLANNTANFNGQPASYYALSSDPATAYSNAVSVASADASTKAATAYSNAVSVSATDASTKAATAYSNAIAYSGNAALAFANAVAYAASNTYVNTQLSLKANLTGATFAGAVAAANLNTTGTLSADIITVSNVAQTQTNLQVDPAGSAFLNAIIYG
jgi:hypothetical protein